MPAPGTHIGPYVVVEPLGSGAMGEVYRARDVRLQRDVALKVLPSSVAADPQRLARSAREAQLLAALNHPHIAAIYGVEESDSGAVLVLELVDGPTLAERISQGPIPHDEAIAIGAQIAEALEAAHENGIVHRDLKPANIKLRPDGTVKILDFGLARMAAPASESDPAALAASRTFTAAGTQAGLILGTAAYMSPEQARGKAVDKRTDIWAFGVVLYEMLTGRRLFDADTVSDTLAAVLTKEPDLAGLPPSTPVPIEALLRRCLHRDVKTRLRDIGEARIVLSDPSSTHVGTSPVPYGSPTSAGFWRRVLPWAAAATAIAATAVVAFNTRPRAGSSDVPLLTVGIDAGTDTPLAGVGWIGLHWVGPTAVLSPDGRSLAFIARGRRGGRWQLYARRLDDLNSTPLAGTEGAYAPFFSPDSSAIGFFAGGRLMKVALNDGLVTSISPAEEARGGAWAEDGTIVFAPRPDGPLFRVSSNGGTPTPTTTLDAAAGEVSHRWPQVLPDGNTFLFTAHTAASASQSGTVIAWSSTDGRRSVVHSGGLYARYTPSGHLIYLNEGRLFAAAFDVDRLQLAGRPVPVVDDVAHALLNGAAQFSFSNTGLLVYRRAHSARRMLDWMDTAGQLQPLRTTTADYQEARFSEDGTRLALVLGEGAQSDIWIYDIARDAMSRLTFYEDNDWSPIWSPDGAHVAYASWQPDTGTFNLFVRRSDGSGEPQRLTSSPNSQLPTEWHPGGQHLLFSEERPGSGFDLMLLPLERRAAGDWTPGTPRPALNSAANELAGEFSPDGRWLAYTSDESGRSEVFVQPFPGPGGRWQVSTEGAEWVEWRPGGRLFYGRSEEVVMSVPYRVDGRTFRADKPRMWMRIPPGVSWLDPALDSTRAAVIRSEDPRRESMVLIVNFFEHLRRVASSGE